MRWLYPALFFWTFFAQAATIAIIDTGFDLDHEFLKPKILKQETDEEVMSPKLEEFQEWQFHDNSHLKEPIIKDQTELEEILLYRTLRAKGHQQGLSLDEFEWYKKRSSNKAFLEKARAFKKHSHGTFVAGIALREGENIQLFPIRGLHLPSPVIAVEDTSAPEKVNLISKTPEDKFREEIRLSQDRVVKKFSKICKYLSMNKIDVVNASYGITYKNITSKFREKYREITKREIEETFLQRTVREYFDGLFLRTEKIIRQFPQMLFIFSAGNSGIDNDQYPHYPSKIKLPNTISVGAMNGEFLANFSNYGARHVDIGAPGVAILSLVPKVYSRDGRDLYSPSSGTSMAAPYISNLAAQILNINKRLKASDVKRIILETGDVKEHLKTRLISGGVANNEKALKAALLSNDLKLDEAISLALSGLIPMEDSVRMGQPPAVTADALQKKVLDVIPKPIMPQEIEEIQATSELSSSLPDAKTDKLDNSVPPVLAPPAEPKKAFDPIPSSQSEEQSPPPSVDLKPSSSPEQPLLPESPAPAPSPSSP
jgi:subtilisin family serine protease